MITVIVSISGTLYPLLQEKILANSELDVKV